MVREPMAGAARAEELARVYGTPLLVIDTDALDRAIASFEDCASAFDLDVCYAGKALLFDALARRIGRSTLGLDVCSLGELVTAERAGLRPERLVFHGCGKTSEELQAAADGRVGRVVVDHIDELTDLATRATPERPVEILLRINTGIEAHTHAYVRTGGEESKFGFAAADVDAAVETALRASHLRLVGFHSHIGSQIFEAESYAASLPILFDVYARAARLGAPLRELVLGGGFGVDAHPDGDVLDVRATLAGLMAAFDRAAAERGIARPRPGIEPGRSIVAAAGTSLYRVVTVKRQGTRSFAIVDGGIADNPRPALYDAYHHPTLAGRISAAESHEFTLCGRSCENDRLVVAPLPGDLRPGDLVSLGTTGAYTYSMASNYNRFGRPAVVFAGRDVHRLVVRRESAEDVLRNDVVDDIVDAIVDTNDAPQMDNFRADSIQKPPRFLY